MTQAEVFSLMISNYPPSRVTEGPVHKIEIVAGKVLGAYFIGDYKQCLEIAEDFKTQYLEYCDSSDRL